MESKRRFLITSILVCASTIHALADLGSECLAQTKAKSRKGRAAILLPRTDAAIVEELRNSQAVWEAIKKAYEMSGSGTLNKEFGFAVVVDADGGLRATGVTGFEAGRWQASVPSSTAAIFHTHRCAASPRPSGQDRREADRLQIPFFVISRQGLWVYEPDPKRNGKGRSYSVQWH
jgi:hypothetical protein